MSRVIEAAGNLLVAALQTAEVAVKNVTDRRSRRPEDSTRDVPIDAEEVAVLTFRDVVTWVTKNRPNDKRVVKAAILRETSRRSLKVTTVFLDKDGQLVSGASGIPLGRAQRVGRLDQELEEFFGKRDMVLFE
jgi:hypothetical protein